MTRLSVPLRIIALLALLAGLAFLAVRIPSANAEPEYVLAVSWQPAFCETRPKVRECRNQGEDRADTRQFSLHGLWPQSPKGKAGRAYCGVKMADIKRDKTGRWRDLDMKRLSGDLWQRLKTAMPGTQSHLERHEWIKHGTCVEGATPESYFATSLALLDALNASSVRELFAGNIGKQISGEAIRNAFDTAFGPGAGGRLRIACKQDDGRRLITELTIGLSGAMGEKPDLATLIAAAQPTDPGCPGGIVDPAGLQ
ncbi:MAG: ribonuclease [Salaquimonas sp.]|jgi:ribonuclease T2|nr:ribonuclease [Salaquimonas sp.]